MAQNYTKMWDAFLGGEWATGTEVGEDTDYEKQTREFYKNIIGPAFTLGEDFGSTDLAGTYAQFSNVDFERAEREFRSAIGDPYGGGAGDPFSWEKVSRYNTEDPAGVGRLQDLLEDQLYGQGKFLGGETGADYGLETSRTLEDYTTGLRGESEALTHGSLTSGAALASGTSGATLRSGESTAVAEDVLIEAYKKAKTLGSDYRAGKEGIERNLETDLNDALTTYLETVDEEKERWFGDVMRNVHTFEALEMGDEDTALALTDAQLEAKMGEMDLEGTGSDFYANWACGYGQEWDPSLNNGEGGCKDTTSYEEEVAGYGFRESEICGIGEIWDGQACVLREELDLEADNYGRLCEPTEIDECGVCNGDGSSCADECGVPNGDNSTCTDECGVLNGDNSSCDEGCGPNQPGKVMCGDGVTMVCDYDDCPDIPVDQTNCPPGDPTCDPTGDLVCDEGYEYDAATHTCQKIIGYNPCPEGQEVAPSGECYTPQGVADIHCPDGTWAPPGPSWDVYQYCLTYPEQDQEDIDCPCECYTIGSGGRGKARSGYTICERVCPGDPRDGEECGGGGGGGVIDIHGRPHAGA